VSLTLPHTTILEVEHKPLGNWRGVVGMQYTHFDFSSLGGEAFVPKTETESIAVFAVEEYILNEQWSFELGARQEHLTQTPDDRNGQALAKGGIATNRRYKDASGMQKDETMFIDLTFFGRTAEIANQYLGKGRQVLVEGRLVLEQYFPGC